MKALIDTNVILDVLLRRDPFYNDSRAVFDLVEQRKYTGCVSSSAMTDIFYFLYKAHRDINKVYASMDDLASIFTIAPVLESTINNALALRWKDFEDAVQYAAAERLAVDYIVTRNPADFSSSSIEVVTPDQFIRHITGLE
ncbi:twitching motility protein PilT [Campylobacterota bacterium]|nr:twitching motility protein PilT [Campylobacterota bacterium]